MANQNLDVFGVDSRIGGAWSLDGAVVLIDAGDGKDPNGDPTDGSVGDMLIVNSIDISYQRRSQKFSPLNQNRKYLAIGEADGVLRMGLIIGPHAAIIDFLQRFSKACEIEKNIITIRPSGMRQGGINDDDCPNNKKFAEIAFKAVGCIINSLSISVRQSGSVLTVVNAGIDMQFISLQVSGDNVIRRPGIPAGGGGAGVLV